MSSRTRHPHRRCRATLDSEPLKTPPPPPGSTSATISARSTLRLRCTAQTSLSTRRGWWIDSFTLFFLRTQASNPSKCNALLPEKHFQSGMNNGSFFERLTLSRRPWISSLPCLKNVSVQRAARPVDPRGTCPPCTAAARVAARRCCGQALHTRSPPCFGQWRVAPLLLRFARVTDSFVTSTPASPPPPPNTSTTVELPNLTSLQPPPPPPPRPLLHGQYVE